jgi:adenylate cyclase
VNYDGLDTDYWNKQIERVESLRQRISDRAAVTPGRVIPSGDDLVIGTGRRIKAAIMFTDISAFSTRPSMTADEQELMLRVLNLYFTEMIRIVEDYGGVIEKNTGDGLMAYFERGFQGTAEENCVQRAVSCALTMDAANSLLIAPILRASGVVPLRHRVTIEHGDITVARIGAPSRFNANVAIGNAANFAAKMLSLVEPDQIGLGAAACSELPESWRTLWTRLADVSTGWIYSVSKQPYPLYLYGGRWARLQ